MEKYQWTFGSVGERTRVKIQSGEDIRHLAELDQKLWSVLSCPVAGLEIPEDSLKVIDLDKDGYLHVTEIIATAQWLCSTLKNPDILFAGSDTLALSEIANTELLNKAKIIAKDKESIQLADIQSFIADITIPLLPEPEKPYDDDVMAGFLAKEKEYKEFFRIEKLAKLGIGSIPEEMVRPVISFEDFSTMGTKIHTYESALADTVSTNENNLKSARAEYADVLKLLLLCRDFCRLLRNFITLEDFYNRDSQTKAIFQVGTLVIDQRICHLVMRVSDMAKHDVQAEKSGMYLVYCDCKNNTLNATMKIVAAVTVGEINNLFIGKNAIFYDMHGNDWDATIYKIIDNPISIRQAFWSPYRKFGKWVTELINKSASEKDEKMFSEVTTKVQDTTAKVSEVKDETAGKVQPFDIAKFAGIFAAIGMALGFIGNFLTSLAQGVHSLPWWQLILCIISLILVISGPSMIMAWIKLRNRNLAPLLNANGWAVNCDAIVSVMFGKTLTEIAQFPIIKLPKVFSKGKKITLIIALLLLLLVVIGVIFLYREGTIELFNEEQSHHLMREGHF